MPHFVTSEINDGATILNVYSGISAEDLATAVNKKLVAAGYGISSGNPSDAVYEKGNRTMRILFGAFVKYFKWGVRIEPGENGQVKVRLHKLTSGMSGGLIGVGQVKSELKRLAAELGAI